MASARDRRSGSSRLVMSDPLQDARHPLRHPWSPRRSMRRSAQPMPASCVTGRPLKAPPIGSQCTRSPAIPPDQRPPVRSPRVRARQRRGDDRGRQRMMDKGAAAKLMTVSASTVRLVRRGADADADADADDASARVHHRPRHSRSRRYADRRPVRPPDRPARPCLGSGRIRAAPRARHRRCGVQVVSLWRIADDITPLRMSACYRVLAAGVVRRRRRVRPHRGSRRAHAEGVIHSGQADGTA